jgi:hypothetical protein
MTFGRNTSVRFIHVSENVMRFGLGYTALIIASVAILGWVRSRSVEDRLEFSGRVSLISSNQSISRLVEGSDLGERQRFWPKWTSKEPKSKPEPFYKIKRSSFLGFGCEQVQFGFYLGVRYFVPYWFVVAALMVLSTAFLWRHPNSVKPMPLSA